MDASSSTLLNSYLLRCLQLLAMSRLPTFRSPVPGLPMSHWR
jgi:hypothetical protein